MNRCFQPDIWRASRFYIGPYAKIIELSLKAPAGRGFNRYNFIHRIIQAGSCADFCVFQERAVCSRIVCRSVPIGASPVLAREEKFDGIIWVVAEPRLGKHRSQVELIVDLPIKASYGENRDLLKPICAEAEYEMNVLLGLETQCQPNWDIKRIFSDVVPCVIEPGLDLQ